MDQLAVFQSVLGFVGSSVNGVLGFARCLVDFAFALKLFVTGQIAGGFLDPAFGFVLVAHAETPFSWFLNKFPHRRFENTHQAPR